MRIDRLNSKISKKNKPSLLSQEETHSGVKSLPKTTQTPQLNPLLQDLLEKIKLEIVKREGNLSNSEIKELINLIADSEEIELSVSEFDNLLSIIVSDKAPFGILQPLVDDPTISDILVYGSQTVQFQRARSNFTSNIKFPSRKTYLMFIDRLLYKAGISYSSKTPVADGVIDEFARINVVHSTMTGGEPYLTIRLSRLLKVNLPILAETGMAPLPILNYLAANIESGNSVLIVGEVATGKTTLARALAASIPSNECMVVIEDTPELVIDHPRVRPMRTKNANEEGAGEISAAQAIKTGMRMAMNRIIFGEIRDGVAAEAFLDACASGHPGLSTTHAKGADEVFTRMELFLGRVQPGVDPYILKQQLATAVQIVVYVDICRVTEKRRIMLVRELGNVRDGKIATQNVFRYNSLVSGCNWETCIPSSLHNEAIVNSSFNINLTSYPKVFEVK